MVGLKWKSDKTWPLQEKEEGNEEDGRSRMGPEYHLCRGIAVALGRDIVGVPDRVGSLPHYHLSLWSNHEPRVLFIRIVSITNHDRQEEKEERCTSTKEVSIGQMTRGVLIHCSRWASMSRERTSGSLRVTTTPRSPQPIEYIF